MKHYDYLRSLEAIWKKAVSLYKSGNKDAHSYFDAQEKAFLGSIGASPREIFDFAEDFHNYGEPDFTLFAMIQDVRRGYFLEVQGGKSTGKTVPNSSFPAKTAAIDGIVWLPRMIEKAKAKLRGELDEDTMYGCGGDRGFFSENDVHPAEFLRIVWASNGNDKQVIDWVKVRRAAR